jgi:hypothetical protein
MTRRHSLDLVSQRQIWRFAIVVACLALSSLAMPSHDRLLTFARMAFLASGIEVGFGCLRRNRISDESLNHWDAAAALAGISSLALGVS